MASDFPSSTAERVRNAEGCAPPTRVGSPRAAPVGLRVPGHTSHREAASVSCDLESGQACDHCAGGCGRVALSDILAGPQEATQLPPPRGCLGHHVGSSSRAVWKPEPLRSCRQGGPSVPQPSAATQDEQPQTTPTPAPSDPGTGQVFPTESPDIMD